MNSAFEIDFDPIADTAGTGDDELLSRVTLHVSGENVTRVHDDDAKLVRPYARLSAARLAEWLAVNWWRLRWESARNDREFAQPMWRLAHQMTAAGDGYIWPNVTMFSTLDGIDVSAVASDRSDKGALRYLTTARGAVPPARFEAVLDRFIGGVVDRAAAIRAQRSPLQRLWRQVNEERGDPDWSTYRRFEAMLGFDPDEASPDLIEALLKERDRVGSTALDEVVAAGKAQALARLRGLRAYIEDSGISARFSGLLQDVRNEARLTRDDAFADAAMLRSRLGLHPASPVPNAVIDELCGLRLDSIRRPSTHQAIGGGLRTGDVTLRVGLRYAHPTSHRFELMRLVGDDLWSDGFPLLPITDAKTSRQRYQRSFAQAVLCPLEGLLQHLEASGFEADDLTQAAHHFDVSEYVVRNVLVNNDVVARTYLPTMS